MLKNIETFAMDESKRPEISILFKEFTIIFPKIINEIKNLIQHLKP
jgi:ABC-type lipopolysaccharide export system ATPase subunit